MKFDFILSWITQALIIIAIVSGFPLVFFYYPNEAFESVQRITNVIPYGLFIRKLHYFSSELALVFVSLHTIYELILSKKPKEKYNFIFASFAFFLILLLLYTGYVLKADQAGKAAALVGENILRDSHILKYISNLVIDEKLFYWKFFLWHILFLPLFLIILTHLHAKKVLPQATFLSIALGLALIVTCFLKLPQDIPFSIPAHHLKGPWFFQGIENMLKLNYPVDLSIILGLFPFLVLPFYTYLKKEKHLHFLLVIWLIFYAYISLAF